MPVRAKIRSSRMLPDPHLNLIESLRKRRIDFLVLPQTLNNRQDRIDVWNGGFRLPVGRQDGIPPDTEVSNHSNNQQEIGNPKPALACFSFNALHGLIL